MHIWPTTAISPFKVTKHSPVEQNEFVSRKKWRKLPEELCCISKENFAKSAESTDVAISLTATKF